MSSCGTADKPPIVVTKVERVRVEIPDPLLTCKRKPPVPGLQASDTELSNFMTAMDLAYDDCRSKLSGIKRLKNSDENQGATVEEFPSAPLPPPVKPKG